MANVLVYREPDHPAEVEFDVVPRAGDQVLWPPKGSSPKFHDVTWPGTCRPPAARSAIPLDSYPRRVRTRSLNRWNQTMRLSIFALVAALSAASLSAQSNPENTASPSLDDTESFIEKYTNANGEIDYNFDMEHKDTNGNIKTYTRSFGTEDHISFDRCMVKHHVNLHNLTNDWKGQYDKYIEIQKIYKIDINIREKSELEGASDYYRSPVLAITHIDPPIFDVDLGYFDDEGKAADTSFGFRNHDVAVRVAKAFAHAVALCGGGKKEPF